MKKYGDKMSLKESSTNEGAKFFDAYIRDGATEILEEYDVNDAQGSGDAWMELGDGVEEEERDDRSGYWSWNDGSLMKYWTATPADIVGQGHADEKVEKEFDRLEKDMLSDYHDQYGKDAPEEGDDFDEFEMDWWTQDGVNNIFAYAKIWLEDRSGKLSLVGEVYRSFDYSYGRGRDKNLTVEMKLTEDQLTKENADKFLKAVEKEFDSYSFSEGEKNVDVQAE